MATKEEIAKRKKEADARFAKMAQDRELRKQAEAKGEKTTPSGNGFTRLMETRSKMLAERAAKNSTPTPVRTRDVNSRADRMEGNSARMQARKTTPTAKPTTTPSVRTRDVNKRADAMEGADERMKARKAAVAKAPAKLVAASTSRPQAKPVSRTAPAPARRTEADLRALAARERADIAKQRAEEEARKKKRAAASSGSSPKSGFWKDNKSPFI